MIKLMQRYGCMLVCGCDPPTACNILPVSFADIPAICFDPSMAGLYNKFPGDIAGKFPAGNVEVAGLAPYAGIVAPFMACVCEGIWDVVKVTSSTPPVSPSIKPFP